MTILTINKTTMAAGVIAGLAVVVGSIVNALIQNKQNKQAQEQQIKDQMALSRDNQKIAMENWQQTNASAQRKQYEKAGLNVGMMYSGSGAGGQTLGQTTAGQTGKRDVADIRLGESMGMGIQASLATKMQQAQIENIQASTEKTKVEAEKIGGVDTKVGEANIQNIIQNTANEKIKGELLAYQTDMQKINNNIANLTQKDIIRQAQAQREKLQGEAMTAVTKGYIDDKTSQEIIKQIQQDTTEQQLRMAATKAGINVTNEQVVKIANEVNIMQQNNMREWDKMEQTDKEIAIKKILANNNTAQTDLNTGTGAYLKQWTSIITDVLNAAR